MIKFNDVFSAEPYNNGDAWKLYQIVPSDNKTGFTTKTTYHPNFKMLAYAVLHRSIAPCESVEEILHAITDAENCILTAAEILRITCK